MNFIAARDYASPHTRKIDYQGGNNAIYIGVADPGALTSEAKWAIQKFTYSVLPDGTSGATDVQWASGTIAFDKIWDNRTSYTYK